MTKNVVGMNELFQLFEDDITLADINAAKYLGKVSGAIVKRRIDLQMTQKEFANYVGVSQGMVSRWEGGDYNFTIRGLAEIAEKLDLELYINLKRYRENIAFSYLEDTDFSGSTNGFSCALDNENEELIVHFLQQVPRIGEDGTVEDVGREEVITLVMGKMVAANLAETLTEMLDNISH